MFLFALIPVRVEVLAGVADADGNSSPYPYLQQWEEVNLTPLLPSPAQTRVTPCAFPLLPPPPHTAGCQSCPPPIAAGLGRASQLWSISSHHGQHLLPLSTGNPFPDHQWSAQHCLGTCGLLYITQEDHTSPSTVAMH